MQLFAFIIGIFSQKILFLPFFLVIFLSTRRLEWMHCLLLVAIGYGWAAWHESINFDKNFPIGLMKVEGEIISFPQKKGDEQQWMLKILKTNTKIWIHCRNKCPSMYPGEIWQLTGRTWKKDSLSNPGDKNFWYQEAFKHISGHMLLQQARLKFPIQWFQLTDRFRRFLYFKAYSCFDEEFSRSLFLTLLLGMGSELSTEDWQIFKDTGTAHLMVVSGAHLSLLMGMVIFLVKIIVRFYPLMIQSIPIMCLSSFVGLFVGFLYAWLCGFGIPVQRAWLMALINSYHFLGSRRFSSWQAWMYALFFILVIEPHAIWYPGFYLSFGSVAVFIWISDTSIQKKWVKHVISQLMCILVLSPLSVLWFQNIPFLGFVVNFLAIPWVSWITLPLSIICALSWSSFLLKILQCTNDYFHRALLFIHHLKILNWQGAWMDYRLPWIWGLVFILWIILPINRIRLSLCIFAIFMSLPHPLRLKAGEYWVDFLDVGQGLSIVIKTQHHQLIYDTGGAGRYWTMAEKVIFPYLHHERILKLHKIIVSHPDLDHRGGLSALMQKFPDAQILVDSPSFYHFGKSCHQTKKWRWDGVNFEFVKLNLRHVSRNNHSCVLKITNQHYQTLLTGDIEKAGESKLSKYAIQSTVLQVPHHGSLTSSTQGFLRQVRPQLAVVSVGMHNRYHLPHLKIIQRYHDLGIPWISTADFGMIRVLFKNNRWTTWYWKSHQRYQFVL